MLTLLSNALHSEQSHISLVVKDNPRCSWCALCIGTHCRLCMYKLSTNIQMQFLQNDVDELRK